MADAMDLLQDGDIDRFVELQRMFAKEGKQKHVELCQRIVRTFNRGRQDLRDCRAELAEKQRAYTELMEDSLTTIEGLRAELAETKRRLEQSQIPVRDPSRDRRPIREEP